MLIWIKLILWTFLLERYYYITQTVKTWTILIEINTHQNFDIVLGDLMTML